MTRAVSALVLAAAALAGATVVAAPRPAALAQASPGLWEVYRLPGVRDVTRECVGNVAILAQYEHRRHRCTSSIVSNGPISTVIQYNCPGGGFGRSTLTMITPRSLRIETQGISDNLPFNYLLQARRVGNCAPRASASAR
jgi:hypothetical protein